MKYNKYNYSSRDKNRGLLVGLLLGAAAGATLGFLLSSEKGREVVGDIKEAAGKAEKDIRKAYTRFEEKLSKSKDFAKNIGKKSREYIHEKTR